MLEQVIMFLITLCVLAIIVYIVIYVLQVIGIPIPGKVVQLLWVIVGLIAILFLVRLMVSGGRMPRILGDVAMSFLT